MSRIQRTRRAAWSKRKRRVRRKVRGTAERPRLTVFRSLRHILGQVVDDDRGATLVFCDSKMTLAADVPEGLSGKCAAAYTVGRALAERAQEKGIDKIVFDRNGYLYHGRVAALARGARDGGLQF